jgi:hypothetical protein
MSIELKIKIKSLADEARTIRTEEQKLRGMEKWNLQHHRKTVVRDAARRSLIAYAFCRLKPWDCSASAEKLDADWKEISRMVRKYGSPEAVEYLAHIDRKLFGRSGDHENAEDACSNAA